MLYHQTTNRKLTNLATKCVHITISYKPSERKKEQAVRAVRSDREYIACIDKIEQEESKQQHDAHLASIVKHE